MRWDLIKTLNDSHHWMLHDDDAPAGLRYNKESHSIRLTTDDKRLFFLEKTGVLQSKMLLRTEYSVITGESYFGNNRLSGILVINENKYSFTVEKDHLKLFRRHHEMVTDTNIEGLGQLDLFEFSALLFGSGLIAGKYHKPALA
jgi:hypothetical protein